MKDRKDAQLAHTLVEMMAATAGVLALTLVMPMALAESLFRTQFGPMALSLCAAGIVFGRYFRCPAVRGRLLLAARGSSRPPAEARDGNATTPLGILQATLTGTAVMSVEQ